MSDSPAEAFAAKLRVNALAGIALTGAALFGLPVFVDYQKPLSFLFWYDNEAAGGIAIDRFLARAGLRTLPETSRTLAGRVAGTKRILNFQRAALLVFLALFVSMAAV
jgi:hypothetical protein